MANFNEWPWGLKLTMLLLPLMLSIMGCGISAFIANTRRFDIVISSIQSNPGLEQMKQFWGRESFRARWLLVCFVCGILIYPGVHLRRGHLDRGELKAFPPGFQRILKISAWLTIVGMTWMVISYGLLKLAEK